MTFIIFPLQSMRMLLRRQVHDDDSLNDSHTILKWYEADDSLHQEKPCAKLHRYSRIHSQDNPSDNNGKQLSDSFRQKPYCERQEVILL